MDKPASNNLVYKVILGFIGLLILCGLSFYGGLAYQKGKQPSATAAQASGSAGGSGFAGGFGGGRSGRFGSIGSVTAVSSSSITVNNSRTNASNTYTINSSTTITNNGTTASIGDIATGDTVLVTPSSSDATVASRILLNPSFGGGGGANTPGSPNSSTDSQIYTN